MTLDGWDEIETHIQVITGVRRSRRTLQRWAARKRHPLPVFDSPGGRGKMADSDALERWWQRYAPQP